MILVSKHMFSDTTNPTSILWNQYYDVLWVFGPYSEPFYRGAVGGPRSTAWYQLLWVMIHLFADVVARNISYIIIKQSFTTLRSWYRCLRHESWNNDWIYVKTPVQKRWYLIFCSLRYVNIISLESKPMFSDMPNSNRMFRSFVNGI